MIQRNDEHLRAQIRSAWEMRKMDTYDIGVMLHVDEADVEREVNRLLDERWTIATRLKRS